MSKALNFSKQFSTQYYGLITMNFEISPVKTLDKLAQVKYPQTETDILP